jgi:ParB-like nuclease family protein
MTEMSKPREAATSTELRNSLCTELERSEISNTSAPAQAQTARLPLDFIRVGGRHRRDMGDIGSLAASMAELGLLHPIVTRPDGALIAGERRLRAAQQLGWKEIPATVIDLEQIVRGEFAENTHRKDFTLSESVAIKRALEPAERVAAKERQGERTDKHLENFSTSSKGRALDKVAAIVGKHRTTIAKAEAIVDAAEAEPEKYGRLATDMDRTGRVNGVYRRLKIAKQAEEIRSLPGNGPYRIAVVDLPWPYERHDEDPSQRGGIAISDYVHCRHVRIARALHHARGLHPLVLDHEPSHARGVRDPRGMGLRTEDDPYLGKGQDGDRRLAARPDRALHHGSARQADRATHKSDDPAARASARTLSEADRVLRPRRVAVPGAALRRLILAISA